MTREEFDALALTRREKGDKPTMATAIAHDAGAGGRPAGESAFAGRPAVIVYGASWCSACHQAMAYFKKKGIAFIEKDIEKDAEAAEEMNGKLRRAGQRGGIDPRPRRAWADHGRLRSAGRRRGAGEPDLGCHPSRRFRATTCSYTSRLGLPDHAASLSATVFA